MSPLHTPAIEDVINIEMLFWEYESFVSELTIIYQIKLSALFNE